MIITVKGADFSGSNIGTLDTYLVSKSIGAGATHEIPNYVTKNASVSWTITLSEGYTFGTYSITMGGATVTPTISSDGMTMTIAISAVTGKVVISVATVNEEGGDSEKSLSEIATLNDNMQTSSTSSALSSSTSYFTYTDIPVTSGKTYRLHYARRIWEFNSSGEAINTFAAHKDVTDYTFTVQSTTATISACYSKSDVPDPTTCVLESIS